jgi:hypothetical protein
MSFTEKRHVQIANNPVSFLTPLFVRYHLPLRIPGIDSQPGDLVCQAYIVFDVPARQAT